MTGRNATRLAWSLGGLILAILLVAATFLILGLDTPPPEESFGFRGWGLILSAAFAIAGVLIASRVPSNPIGWLLLVAGVGVAVQEFGQQYSIYGAYDSPGAVPGVEFAAWIVEWIWIPFMAVVAMVIPLLYPDGHLPSPRWRFVVLVGAVGATIGTIAFALIPGELESWPGLRNPVGVEGADWLRTVGDISMLLFVVGLLGALASVVMRYRRSSGDERQQLKWLALTLSLLGTTFLIGVPYWTLTGEGTSLDLVENVLVISPHLDPGGDRRRDPEVPPLRHRRRDQEDGRVRDPRVPSSPWSTWPSSSAIGTLVGHVEGNVFLSAVAAAAVVGRVPAVRDVGRNGSPTVSSTASGRRRTRCSPDSPNVSRRRIPSRTSSRGWRGCSPTASGRR